MLNKTSLAVLFVMSVNAMFAGNAFEKKLCDLSNQSAFAQLSTNSGATINSSPQKAEGRYILKFNAPQYIAGSKNQWPAVTYTASGKNGMDWSKYDLLHVDCYLKTKHPVLLGAVFRDVAKKRFFEKKSLSKNNTWTTLTFKLNKKDIDTNKLKSFNFYITRPKQDVQIFFTNIRLSSESKKAVIQ